MASCGDPPRRQVRIHTADPGHRERAGTAITTMRVTGATSDGVSVAIAWNIWSTRRSLPTTKSRDDAQVLLADRDDGQVVRKIPISAVGRCCRTRP
jgi:hypothetical protein